jgi:hypothetical protein
MVLLQLLHGLNAMHRLGLILFYEGQATVLQPLQQLQCHCSVTTCQVDYGLHDTAVWLHYIAAGQHYVLHARSRCGSSLRV